MKSRWWIVGLVATLVVLAVAGCQPDTGTNGDNGSAEETPTVDPRPYVETWAASKHAIPVVFAAERPFCSGCHDGRVFSLNATDTAQVEPGPFGPYVVATDCRACHIGRGAEVMSSGQADNVPTADGPVTGGRGALCMSCHNQLGKPDPQDEEHGYPHYGPQADVLNGTGGMTEGLTLLSTDDHKGILDTCVACHMPNGPESHTFMGRQGECPRCHDGFKSAEELQAGADYDGDGQTEAFVAEVQGLMDALYGAVNKSANTDKFVARSGEISFVSGETTLTTVPTEAYVAAYNWVLIDHDRSSGIHNPYFTVTLLQETYRQLTGSALPGAQTPAPSKGE